MIGFLTGDVLFSDGVEAIIQTASGVGHQVYYNKVLVEGTRAAIYVSQIIKEDSHSLFGFHSLRAKKLFEMLLTVKGIGPKSAYALIANLGVNEIINAVNLEAKNSLTKVPGLGIKGASQVILDLGGKIDKVKMYSDQIIKIKSGTSVMSEPTAVYRELEITPNPESSASLINHNEILNDTLMACKELGFKEDKIIPIAQRILNANLITKPEQLIHLVLKEV